jgi:photosystem II protein
MQQALAQQGTAAAAGARRASGSRARCTAGACFAEALLACRLASDTRCLAGALRAATPATPARCAAAASLGARAPLAASLAARLPRPAGRAAALRCAAASTPAEMQFVKGVCESSVPDVKLTRARDGSSGTAIFFFEAPDVFEAANEGAGEITGLYLVDEEGTLSTVDVSAKFVNGKPKGIEAKYTMRSSFEWDRFMRFMERYAEDHGALRRAAGAHCRQLGARRRCVGECAARARGFGHARALTRPLRAAAPGMGFSKTAGGAV